MVHRLESYWTGRYFQTPEQQLDNVAPLLSVYVGIHLVESFPSAYFGNYYKVVNKTKHTKCHPNQEVAHKH